MSIIQERLAQLPTITLAHGSHDDFTEGHCAMEVVAGSAARSAAWSAARSAAESAADLVLAPTVETLKASALDLLDAMILDGGK